MATAWTYDTTNKLFQISASALDVNDAIEISVTEFYSIVKEDWLTDNELRKFRFPLDSIGGQDIGGGSSIAAYISLKAPWKIVPPTHDVYVTMVGNLITSDGSAPFDDVPGDYHHVIKYVVSSNSTTISQDQLVTQIEGLDTDIQAQSVLLQDVDDEVDELVHVSIPALPGEMWDTELESQVSAKHIMQIVSAVLSGKAIVSGDNIKFRDVNDTRDVVDADTTSQGGRPSVTLDNV